MYCYYRKQGYRIIQNLQFIRVYFFKDGKSLIMTSTMSQASRRQFQKFREDFAQMTTQKKSDPLFPSGRLSYASESPPVFRRF